MIKEAIQHTDPVAFKAMASGVGTVGVFGISSTTELAVWASIAADIGVFAGGLTTVILGIQSYRRARREKNGK